MAEDLRARIAAAIYAHDCWDYAGGLECRCGLQFSFNENDPNGDAIAPWSEHVADAVIAELGLEPQVHYDPDCDYYRYVTDWIAPND